MPPATHEIMAMARRRSRSTRTRILLAMLAALVLAILAVQLIGAQWPWVIFNAILQHELRW